MNYPDLPLLWHCYYARIFDSLIVRHLVDNPPKKVRESVYKMGLPLAELLERELLRFPKLEPKLDRKIYLLLSKVDKRFWFPKVQQLMDILDLGDHKATGKIIAIKGAC